MSLRIEQIVNTAGAKKGCHHCTSVTSGLIRAARKPAPIHVKGLIESMARSESATSGVALSSSCVLPGKRKPGYKREKLIARTS